jgi:hypothetical protein
MLCWVIGEPPPPLPHPHPRPWPLPQPWPRPLTRVEAEGWWWEQGWGKATACELPKACPNEAVTSYWFCLCL